jgi:hypothetical protein
MSGISISVKAPNGQFKLTGLSSKTTYGELVTQITKNSSLSEGSFEILMGFPPKLITGTSSFTLETLGIKNGEGLTIRNKGTGGIVKGEGGHTYWSWWKKDSNLECIGRIKKNWSLL